MLGCYMLIVKENQGFEPKNQFYFHKNPLVEMVASLHVLSDPAHHCHCEKWVHLVNAKIGKKLRSEIGYFATNYFQWMFIMDIVTGIACDYEDTDGDDVYKYIRRINDLDDLEFSYLFLDMGALRVPKQVFEKWIKKPETIDDEIIKPVLPFISKNSILLFLQNITTYKNRIVDTLTKYWETIFSSYWKQIEPYISKIIVEHSTLATMKKLDEYLLSFHNSIHIKDNKLILLKEIKYEMDLDSISVIHVFPSVFTAPHLMMDIRNEDLILYCNLSYYSVIMTNSAPEDLVERIKALSDESRLKILKILWTTSATTQELSNILNLVQSTISVHLKVLKNAGLVTSRQQKKYVYYSAVQETVESVLPGIVEYFTD